MRQKCRGGQLTLISLTLFQILHLQFVQILHILYVLFKTKSQELRDGHREFEVYIYLQKGCIIVSGVESS